MGSTRRKMKKTATRSGDDKDDRVRGAATEDVRIEVNEERTAIVSRKVETENIDKTKAVRTKEPETNESKKVKTEMNKNILIDTLPTDFSAAEPETGP